MKTILATGACGFIGSRFVRMLLGDKDWRVVNLDRLTYAGDTLRVARCADNDRYRFVRGDIADRTLLERLFREEKPHAVVNFAAESHVDRSILDPLPFLHTNILGLQVLLEIARAHGVERFVHISTDEVYGDLAGERPVTEGAPLRPSSPYAASKAAADLLCLAYRRTYGVPCLLVRSSNNYGPWQFPEKLIPLMIRNAVNRDPLPLYGDGAQRRDWLHVEDNCRAILLVLERGEIGSIYNVGAGEERTNVEVVGAICHALAKEGAVHAEDLLMRIEFVPDRPGHDRRYAMDTRKIRDAFGWRPVICFADGIQRTVRWYLRHDAWLKRVTRGEVARYCGILYAQHWGATSRGGHTLQERS